MSSILKALKKLEEEKSLREEQTEINVSREILKQTSNNRDLLKLFWLLGSVAVLVIIILAVALMRTTATKVTVPSQELPLAVPSATTRTPVQNVPAASRSSDRDKGVLTGTPSSTTAPVQRQLRDSTQSPEAVSPQLHQAKQPEKALPVVESQKTESPVKSTPVQIPASNEPSLTLSGIAWNKDSADRLAIINGQPTATGGTISGMVVEEILPDRVKLSHNGRTFELQLGKNSKTE